METRQGADTPAYLSCLQNCLNSSWHSFNEVLETFLWDVGPYDMLASHGCCRFAHHIPALLYWIEIWWQWRPEWTYCHVPQTSLRCWELCGVVEYPAGSSHQKMGTLVIKGRTWHQASGRHFNDAQLVLKGPKVCQENTIAPPPPGLTW